MKIASIVVGLLILSTCWVFTQSLHADINAQIGSYNNERLDTRLRIRTGSSLIGTSGILIENAQSRAHTWLPYKDGSIYLTGDGVERQLPDGSIASGDGNIILRTYDSQGYHNIMTLDGTTKEVRINSLAQQLIPFPITDTGNGLVIADRQGDLVRRQGSEIWSGSAFAMGHGARSIEFDHRRRSGKISIHLPNGVRIRSVKAVVVDDNPDADVYFQFDGYDANEGQEGVVAWGKSTGTPGLTTFWAEHYGERIIDNNGCAYHITVGGFGPHENYDQGGITFRSIHIYYDY